MDGNRLSEGKGCPPTSSSERMALVLEQSTQEPLEARGLALLWLWLPPRDQKAEGAVELSMDEPHQNCCHPLQHQLVDVSVHEAHAARRLRATP